MEEACWNFLWIGLPQYSCEGGDRWLSPCSKRKAEEQHAEQLPQNHTGIKYSQSLPWKVNGAFRKRPSKKVLCVLKIKRVAQGPHILMKSRKQAHLWAERRGAYSLAWISSWNLTSFWNNYRFTESCKKCTGDSGAPFTQPAPVFTCWLSIVHDNARKLILAQPTELIQVSPVIHVLFSPSLALPLLSLSLVICSFVTCLT